MSDFITITGEIIVNSKKRYVGDLPMYTYAADFCAKCLPPYKR